MNPGGYVAFTLYVGAAFADANRDQRSLLRTRIPPMAKRLRECVDDPQEWRLVAESILIVIKRIMGPKWLPKEEWAFQINLMLGRASALEKRTAAAMDVGQQAAYRAAVGKARQAEEED